MLYEYSSRYAWSQFRARCSKVIQENGYGNVADIGGGRKPLFTPQEVAELSIGYAVVDISSHELSCAPSQFTKICADVCDLQIHDAFDFVFSVMFCEHVRDARKMHLSILNALRPGGQAFHFYPAKYCLPFMVNRMLPDRITKPVLLKIRPDRHNEGIAPKFKAYYRNCTGPTKNARSWFTALGYEVMEHSGFYGHSYLRGIPVLSTLSDFIDEVGAKTQNPYLCSYSFLRLRKPQL